MALTVGQGYFTYAVSEKILSFKQVVENEIRLSKLINMYTY